MNVVAHIGMHKTGSTTIQQFLVRNEAELAKAGIYFPHLTDGRPGTARNRLLTIWVENGGSPPNLEKPPAGAKAMLISNEGLCRVWSEEQIDRVRSVLPETTRIVCYYREPSRHIVSRYKQNVKSKAWRATGSLQEFVAKQTEGLREPGGYYRADSKAELWRSRFPDYRALPYGEKSNEELVRSFMDACGLDTQDQPVTFSEYRNASPSNYSAFLLAQLVPAAASGDLSVEEFEDLQRSVKKNDAAYTEVIAPHVRTATVDLSAFVDTYLEVNPQMSKLLGVPAASQRETVFPAECELDRSRLLEVARSVRDSILAEKLARKTKRSGKKGRAAARRESADAESA